MRALLSRPGRAMRRTPTSRRETFCPPNMPIRRALAVTASPPNGRRTKRRGSRGRTTATAGPACSRASSRRWSSSCARSRRASRSTSMCSMPSTSATSASCSRGPFRRSACGCSASRPTTRGHAITARSSSRGLAAKEPRLAVDFDYNAWGGKYPPFDLDREIGRQMADALGVPRYAQPGVVLEGGLDRGQRRGRAADDGAMPAEPEPQSDADARRHRAPVARHLRRSTRSCGSARASKATTPTGTSTTSRASSGRGPS